MMGKNRKMRLGKSRVVESNRILQWAALMVATGIVQNDAFAAGSSGLPEISVSAGIASPSATSAILQNPAGLTRNRRLQIEAHSAFPGNGLENPTLGAGIFGGGNGFGAGAGVNHSTQGSVSTAYYGLGVQAGGAGFSLGISGMTSISNGGGSSFDLGLLIGGADRFRIGATVMDFTESGREFGLGVGFGLGGGASFVTDLAIGSEFDNPWLQPGIVVGSSSAALTLSYGFALRSSSSGTSQVSDGITFGGSLEAGQNLRLSVYYRQLSHLYAGLGIAL